ncbi:MAG: Maf family protein, partial [Clostridia bacterium]|nr:Maf family protein [Clostridia bacterium]
MEYVLASASPRRRELLSQILPKFEVIPSAEDEKVNISLFPEQMACALAERKCDGVFAKNPYKTVIGCDTVVVFGNKVLGKPKDRREARATLKRRWGQAPVVIKG